MSDGGKGSTPRPIKVPKEQYDKNWDNIFKKKQTSKEAIEQDKKDKAKLYESLFK